MCSAQAIAKGSKKAPAPRGTVDLSRGGVRALLVLFVLAYAGSLFVRPIHLTEADLGRHIKNGELFLETLSPLQTNFYSYTQPDHPAPNHHWGAGVVFYAIWQALGFSGLEIVYSLLHVAIVGLLWRSALREAGFGIAWLVTFASIPLLAFRPEIRPEGLSYLFFVLFYLLLWDMPGGKRGAAWCLAPIPFLQVMWTNVHIFFCFGPLLVAAAAWDARLRGDRATARARWITALVAAAACFVNPFGLAGVLEPFTIFQEYGYLVAENQSVLELQRSYHLPVLAHFEVMSAVALLLLFWGLRRSDARRELLVRGLLLVGFGVLAWRVGRAVALFALLAIPVLSALLARVVEGRSLRWRGRPAMAIPVVCASVLIAAVAYPGTYASPFSRAWGLGLEPRSERSARFFLENGLEGPIFNDYDIGGHLIFSLFPKERVFVDNRPEAYSVDFFRKVYIPMQRDEQVWKAMEERFAFNTIFFSRRDRAPWARSFLVRRIQDPEWVPLFADPYAVILVKRMPENAALIRRFAPRGTRR